MKLPDQMPRELVGLIVDKVHDGAIEDTSPIIETYDIIAEYFNKQPQGINWQPMDIMPKDKLVSLKTKTGAIITGKRFHAPYGNDSNYFYVEHAELFSSERVDRISLSVNFVGWSELIEVN